MQPILCKSKHLFHSLQKIVAKPSAHASQPFVYRRFANGYFRAFQKSLFGVAKEPILETKRASFAIRLSLFWNSK